MYNPRVITVKVVLPEGYYDDDDDVLPTGILMLQDVFEEAGIEFESIEQ